jgi:thiol:disulfide interchange protein DsbA
MMKMNRRDFSVQLGLSTLALGAGSAFAQGGFQAGKEYQRLGQALPTPAGKIEVIEFFWYGCPHCYVFEPQLDAWVKALPADVSFRHVHAGFRENLKTHQRTYYALESLGREQEFRARIFNAVHRGGMALDDLKSMTDFLAKLGLDPAKFQAAYNSFGVQNKCLQADKLFDNYRADGVPALGIAGRFFTSPSMAGANMPEAESGRRALAVTDYLLQQVRSGKA